MTRTIKQLANGQWSGTQDGRVVKRFGLTHKAAWNAPERDGYDAALAWQLVPEWPKVGAAATWLAQQATDGWTITSGDGQYNIDGTTSNDVGYRWVRFARTDGIEAVVALTVSPTMTSWDKTRAARGVQITGHTFVNGGCFTRRGIDCDSCRLVDEGAKTYGDDEQTSVASLLASQWARCVRSVNNSASAVSVPGLPYKRQPAWFRKTAIDLRRGASVTLVPHGFGTGHRLTPHTSRGLSQTRAALALETKLGVSPIYIEIFDHD